MTGLADLLSGATPAGLYRGPPGVPHARVAHEASAAGWRAVTLDTSEVADKGSLLREAARAFAFPEWFGHNWDALEEGLGDVVIGRGLLVAWEGWGALAQRDPETFEVLLEILRERARDPRLRPFAVLLLGAGPDVELPEL